MESAAYDPEPDGLEHIVTPVTTSETNTNQSARAGSPPAIWTVINGKSTMAGTFNRAPCAERPNAATGAGLSWSP